MKTAKSRNTLSRVMVVGLALTLLVGTFAYFTDRVETNAKVTAGTVGITEADTWTANLTDADGARVLDNINPGDSRSLAFSVTNTGNKAIDVRHTLQLSVLDAKNQPKAMSMRTDIATKKAETSTEADVAMLQFEIYKASDVIKTSEENGNQGYLLKTGAEPLFTSDSVDGTSKMGAQRDISRINEGIVTYYFADTILDGVGEQAEVGYAAAEHTSFDTTLTDRDVALAADANGNANAKVDYDYVLIFRDTALNDFQGCTVHLDLEVEAKQHLNTRSSWQHIETISTTLNTSPVASQNTAIEVAPDNNTGVLNDVTDLTAGTYNGTSAH